MSEGTIQTRATLAQVTAKKNGDLVVQLEPDDYITPEEVADLIRMRGKVVAVQIVDPDQPLPLEYEEPEDEQAPGLALAE